MSAAGGADSSGSRLASAAVRRRCAVVAEPGKRTREGAPMTVRIVIAGIAALVLSSGAALSHDEHAHDEHAGHAAHGLGEVNFSNSCAPAVQADFGRGVAMLHSFWFSAGERTFGDVLAKDPACAIAAWGIASLLMSNPLNGVGPTPQAAEKAQAAI